MRNQTRRPSLSLRITILGLAFSLSMIIGTAARSEAGGCSVLLDIISFGITAVTDACKPFSVESSPPVATTCTLPALNGRPQFLSVPKGSAKYPFAGGCTRPDQPGIQLKYRWEGSWTPAETNPSKPNASESIEIIGYEPFIPERAPGGKIHMYWTARCNYDPWLRPETSAGCRRMGEFIPDDLRQIVPDLTGQGFPQTKNVIPPAERQRLAGEYLRANPPVASTFNPAATKFTSPHEMFTIIKPTNGERVVQGKLVITAQPPKVGATPVTELEFRWLDAPQNQPYVNTFAVDTPKLLQGYSVAQAVTRGHTGRWEVRARPSGKAVPGPWSLAVPFQLLLTQPTQSQKQALSPMVQQAPLQSSSVMQAPAPSSSPTTQMRRSPSMIMPRGIEEKGGMESNQTVDEPAKTEKKP